MAIMTNPKSVGRIVEAGEIGVTDGPRAPPVVTDNVVTAPVTVDAPGTPFDPLVISLTLLLVALKFVVAIEI